MKIPALLKFALAVTAAYVVFSAPGWLLAKPVPVSLMTLYMLFAVVMALLVMTITDEGAGELVSPVAALLKEPSKRFLRNIVFAAVPLIAAFCAYAVVNPGIEAPMELRTVHPAPPAAFAAYGKNFNMAEIENPLRALEKTEPERFRELVKEGGVIYFKNCFFCHGAKLDGRGHYASSLSPPPLPFTGQDTIAQLKESYVFWRLVKGGPGLPKEAAPQSSAMPAWENSLNEDEVWRTILFLYDYAGVSPRLSRYESARRGGLIEEATADENGAAVRGKDIYERRCWWCHGKDGAGNGPAAEFLNPAPRDFTWGVFKWKTTPFDEPSPSDDDLYNMIAKGMSGTSMPGWGDLLRSDEIKAVSSYIKTFGKMEDAKKPPIDLSGRAAPGKDGMERGRKIFSDRCVECHGEAGRGDGAKKLKDDWGQRTWPRNLTKGWNFRAGDTAEGIYTRITVGIPGTQMPSFADPKSTKMLSSAERWDVANYAASLNEPDKRPGADNVIKAVRVAGRLPDKPDDAAWAGAQYASFLFAPQIIAGDRLFKPTLDSISVKALYNGREAALLLEWDDPTRSIPGDAKSAGMAEGELFEDAVAVEFPGKYSETPGAGRPYFGMGQPNAPVTIHLWKSGQTALTLNAKGFSAKPVVSGDEEGARPKAYGVYDKGVWRVVMKGALSADAGKDARLEAGSFIPIAFAAWDGSNGERGARHVMTTWQWLALMSEKGVGGYSWLGPLLWPLGAAVFVFLGELLLLRSVRGS